MKIVDSRKSVESEFFNQLQVGDVFIDEDGDINIKVYDDNKDYYAVVLKTGLVWFPADTHCVIKLNAHLVIEN